MNRVADISPGTVLVAGFTGRRYVVQSVDEDEGLVYVRGLPALPMDELQRDIANGKIGVVG